MYRAVDCQGFAGGFTLGVVEAGWHLVAKREMVGGFGVANCEANRHLLGNHWDTEAVDYSAWSVPAEGAQLVFGNPPCSGFSGLSTKSFRGVSSPVNDCMWALVRYAARVRPEIVIFESVRAAYTQGATLMTDLLAELRELTNQRWTLYHVVHDAYALGGPAIRRRYFWVASRVPFGVEHPELPVMPTLDDAIGDLENLGHTWGPQPYRAPASYWARKLRSVNGVVDGHMPDLTPFGQRVTDLALGVEWTPGEDLSTACRRYYETHGRLPESWKVTQEKHVRDNFNFGFSSIHRWRGHAPAHVITGAGPATSMHPRQPRTLTFREVARIMGFPDDWRIMPLVGNPGMRSTWGKGITVDAGRWIGTWALRSLEGHPGSSQGTPVRDGEREIVVAKPRVKQGNGFGMLDLTQVLTPMEVR